MITKEQEIKKYCCFYASDFHLEMILLPYIKNNINNDKFIIFTEENLVDSMKILLDKTNLNPDEKNKVLALDWNIKQEDEGLKNDFEKTTIIINGSSQYIKKINEKIKNKNPKKINIIDCYDINEKNLEPQYIQKKYNDVLNTSYNSRLLNFEPTLQF